MEPVLGEVNDREKMAYCILLLTHYGLMTPYGGRIYFNIDSGNVLLSVDTKPLPEPMLIIITKVQWCSSDGKFAWDIIAISH